MYRTKNSNDAKSEPVGDNSGVAWVRAPIAYKRSLLRPLVLFPSARKSIQRRRIERTAASQMACVLSLLPDTLPLLSRRTHQAISCMRTAPFHSPVLARYGRVNPRQRVILCLNCACFGRSTLSIQTPVHTNAIPQGSRTDRRDVRSRNTAGRYVSEEGAAVCRSTFALCQRLFDPSEFEIIVKP